jgi:hypothetical protein
MFTWGLVAVCALDLLFVTALFLRNRAHSLFLVMHIICFIVSLIAVSSFGVTGFLKFLR